MKKRNQNINNLPLKLALTFGISLFCSTLTFAQGNPLDPTGGGGGGEVIVDEPQNTGLPAIFEGEGLRLSIEQVDGNTGNIRGSLTMNGSVFPFNAQSTSASSFSGQFDASGQRFDFTAENDSQGNILFRTGSTTYRLQPANAGGGGGGDVPPPNPPAGNSIAGTWSGTASDTTDDGQPVTFPVKMTINSAGNGSITADVQSTVPYPTGDGQTVSVEITGRFTGRSSGNNRYELHTSNLTGKANGQTMPLGESGMRLELSADGKTINGWVGDDEEGWSPMQLQRQGRIVQPDPRPVVNDPHRQRTTVPQGTVEFEKVTLRDSGMDNMISHTFLKPKGWQVQGGQQWNPQLYKDFVHLNLAVTANDGRQMRVYPGGFYEDSNIYEVSQRMGLSQQSQRPQPGQPLMNGMSNMPVPQSASEYVSKILLPAHRPQATNVQVIGETDLPILKRQMDEMMKPLVQQMQIGDQQLRQMGGNVQTTMNAFAQRVRVSYTENGQSFEEDIYVTGWIMDAANDMFQNGMIVHQWNWMVIDPRGLRAPAGQLDQNTPLLESMHLSVQQDPKYMAVIMSIRNKIAKQEMDALIKRGEIARKGREEAWRIHQEGVRAQQVARDKNHDDFIDMIRDVDKFQDIDGSTVKLPSVYSNVYSNGNGGFIMTNDPIDPNDGSLERWERINPKR